ncbi:hypothetical protein CQW23_06463 [Capsicum baccatum]|uniref:Protein kinase domain-containing protein n=1 Tax=Capsicum baccatum TaxID=33114 RepID=A0A2G2X3H1_CAPBA|nr:hypothetical protein CQW23_06463 [Capsicum baccatum]
MNMISTGNSTVKEVFKEFSNLESGCPKKAFECKGSSLETVFADMGTWYHALSIWRLIEVLLDDLCDLCCNVADLDGYTIILAGTSRCAESPGLQELQIMIGRFMGGNGVMLYFHGAKETDFSIFSDDNLHINAHLIGTQPQGRNGTVRQLMSRRMEMQNRVFNTAERSVVVKRTDDLNIAKVTVSTLLQLNVKLVPIGVNIRSFSYNELEEATNGFEEELGTGALSTVYKAILNDENGKIVDVKKLTEGEQGFLAEVNSISRNNHKNLVNYLSSATKANTGFCPRVVQENAYNRQSGRVQLWNLAFRADLLQKSYKQDVANENEMILAEWVCDCYRRKELHLLAGDDEEPIEDIKRLEKLLMVAIWCIQENPALRPRMKKVMLTLEGSVEVSIHPDPFSFI